MPTHEAVPCTCLSLTNALCEAYNHVGRCTTWKKISLYYRLSEYYRNTRKVLNSEEELLWYGV